MLHRNPGDASTLSPVEQPFGAAAAWVQAEAEALAAGEASFTRVLIGDLKPEVLRLIMEDEGGTHICQVRGSSARGAVCREQGRGPFGRFAGARHTEAGPGPGPGVARGLSLLCHWLAQELAHLYHYYLHGEGGNRGAGCGGAQQQGGGLLPNGEPLPDITLHYLEESRTVWSRKLAEVRVGRGTCGSDRWIDGWHAARGGLGDVHAKWL